MKLLVTGTAGQVARSLVERGGRHDDIEIVALGRPHLDLERPASVKAAIAAANPDIVVSAAAYTAVDQAEDEADLAYAVNVTGAQAVAAAAGSLGVPVIHLSTDYVFAGEGDRPYDETDEPAPAGVYGRTKLAGEIAVAEANPRHLILRTAWVYSPFGKNFVKTMLSLAEKRPNVSVVSDQWGNPTSALDIADGILHLAKAAHAVPEAERYGIFHLAGTGNTNWSGFSRAIFEASRAAGGPFAEVLDIGTSDYPTKARRPPNSRLSTEKLERIHGWKAPDWTRSCIEVVDRLVKDG